MRYFMETIEGRDQPPICENDIVLEYEDVWCVRFKASFQEVDIVTNLGLESQPAMPLEKTYKTPFS
jgi:hypothetical protein